MNTGNRFCKLYFCGSKKQFREWLWWLQAWALENPRLVDLRKVVVR